MNLRDTTPVEIIGYISEDVLDTGVGVDDNLIRDLKLALAERVRARGGKLLENFKVHALHHELRDDVPEGKIGVRLSGYATWPGADDDRKAAEAEGQVFP